jgi:hypothetical protein
LKGAARLPCAVDGDQAAVVLLQRANTHRARRLVERLAAELQRASLIECRRRAG